MFRFLWVALFCIPAVVFFHSEPLPSFLQDYSAILLVCIVQFVASFYVLKNGVWVGPLLGIWVLWGGVIAASILFNSYALNDVWVNYVYAWLFSGLLIAATSQMVGALGREVLVRYTAEALVLASAVAAIIGVLQFYGVLSAVLYWVPDAQDRLIGSFFQANMSGVFSVLGIAAALYLLGCPARGKWGLFLVLPLLVFTVVASGSRTAWFGLFGLWVGYAAYQVLLGRAKGQVDGRPLVVALVITVGVAASSGWIDVQVYSLAKQHVPLDRSLIGETAEARVNSGSISERYKLWRTALPLVRENLVFGGGVGNFGVQYFELTAHNGAAPEVRQYWSNAHNLFLMVLIEMGMLGLAVLAISVVVAGIYLVRSPVDRELVFIVSILGVLSAYSLLEYPLYYFHMLAIFVAALALLFPARRISLEVPKSVVLVSGAFLVTVIGVGALYLGSYVSMVSMVLAQEARNPQEDYISLSVMEHDRYMGGYASLLKYQFFPADAVYSEADLKRLELLRAWKPRNIIVARQAVELMLGRQEEACEQIGIVSTYYPQTREYFSAVIEEMRGQVDLDRYRSCIMFSP